MTNQTNSTTSFWKKLRNNYRLQLIDTHSYDVRWVLELSRLNILLVASAVFLLFLILSFLFFAFTPMKYLLPGFVGTNADDKRELIALKIKTEAFDKQLYSYKLFVDNLSNVLKDSMVVHEDYKNEQLKLLQADMSLFFPQPGQLEISFRKDFELLLKQGDKISRNDKHFILNSMQMPVEGKPVPPDKEDVQTNTLTIKSKGDASVVAVLEGLVIAKYKVGDEVHLYIQHMDYIVSSYKFEGVSKVTQGEEIAKGQLIGIISDKGTKTLNLDIWANAETIPPGQYLKY